MLLGLEDIATYIMEEYFYGEACGDIEINDLLRQKAQLIKNLQVGNIPPAIILATIILNAFFKAKESK